jgi:recombinational DNA repair protein (RecF pathway)
MPHHIYHTEAIVIGARALGEGDRAFFLLTRDLGLVRARARSIRLNRSRLRYALQLFSHAEVDLVRGKDGWRLTTARGHSLSTEIWEDRMKRRVLLEYGRLLRRLVTGEDHGDVWYIDLSLGLTLLALTDDIERVRDIEVLLLVRLLASLGYWGGSEPWAFAVGEGAWGVDVFTELRASRPLLVARANAALRESGM